MIPEFTSPLQTLLAAALASYCLGSISFGILCSKLFGLGELRKIGSGNIGATNVLRTGNRAAAAATLFLDMAKGFLAVAVCDALAGELDAVSVAALAVFAGHLFPVWHRFKGGKGVATYFGILAALSIPGAAVVAVTWLSVFMLTRTASKSSLVSGIAGPFVYWMLDGEQHVVVLLALGIAMLLAHRQNIARILRGTEQPISLFKPSDKQ
ncbi:MAG: glycerol-3-phosphate 1-O-acyltransferase PlsY [Rhodobacteraceae bacterium]|nr:glycerol-3-phosphate 1-O-acyltransferase PlsY [Paracoccaceae bacterium]